MQTMGKATGGFMIMTIFALAIGAFVGVGSLVIIAFLLAYLEETD
jgi:hypothetical protein